MGCFANAKNLLSQSARFLLTIEEANTTLASIQDDDNGYMGKQIGIMNKKNLSERDICTKCIMPALEQADRLLPR